MRFVDEIPKTGADKFAKSVLRDLLETERANTNADPAACCSTSAGNEMFALILIMSGRMVCVGVSGGGDGRSVIT